MAETALWNLIRDVRTRAGLNPRELARQLKMSPAHLYQIEDEKSGALPSDETLRAIARVCCEDPQERAAVAQRLLLARARLIVSPEVAAYLSPRVEEKMPEEFQRRLQADLAGRREHEIRLLDAQLSFNGRLGLVAAGLTGLTKSEVRALAVALGQPVEDYLVAAGYFPDWMLPLVRKEEGGVGLFDVLRNISEKGLGELASVLPPAWMKLINGLQAAKVEVGQKK
ncbi:MAG: helix-turn-helix domain-containing protein [Acidobacteria bacterium]|nr:helix-turn-helix domain-containing protein [Acidobacteriota bacterium]